MEAPKRPRGRPPAEGPTATEQVHIRVTIAEKSRYERAAAKAKESLSAWVKRVLDRAAR